jgi:pimeloyl-ACP methyl ester carboxylesterase
VAIGTGEPCIVIGSSVFYPKIFEKSGHYPQMEESELFNRELLNWIKKN